jgi:hypothetical protein
MNIGPAPPLVSSRIPFDSSPRARHRFVPVHLSNHGRSLTFLSMSPLSDLGKLLMIVGLIMVVTGAFLWSGLGRGWLGRLPGDLHFTHGRFGFTFPIVTCLLLSAIVTLFLWLFRK